MPLKQPQQALHDLKLSLVLTSTQLVLQFIMNPATTRAARAALTAIPKRTYSSQAAAPRHLLSISDLSPSEFTTLVRNAAARKTAVKSGQSPALISSGLAGRNVAMMFSKRSTRTRVSTESAVTMLGGHPMFLGKDDIQLGVSQIHPGRLML